MINQKATSFSYIAMCVNLFYLIEDGNCAESIFPLPFAIFF